jgi:hypothetical protein
VPHPFETTVGFDVGAEVNMPVGRRSAVVIGYPRSPTRVAHRIDRALPPIRQRFAVHATAALW